MENRIVPVSMRICVSRLRLVHSSRTLQTLHRYTINSTVSIIISISEEIHCLVSHVCTFVSLAVMLIHWQHRRRPTHFLHLPLPHQKTFPPKNGSARGTNSPPSMIRGASDTFPRFSSDSCNDSRIHAENLIEGTIVCRCIVALVACAWLRGLWSGRKEKKKTRDNGGYVVRVVTGPTSVVPMRLYAQGSGDVTGGRGQAFTRFPGACSDWPGGSRVAICTLLSRPPPSAKPPCHSRHGSTRTFGGGYH